MIMFKKCAYLSSLLFVENYFLSSLFNSPIILFSYDVIFLVCVVGSALIVSPAALKVVPDGLLHIPQI